MASLVPDDRPRRLGRGAQAVLAALARTRRGGLAARQGALALALDPQGNGAAVAWDNPDTGLKGGFTPVGRPFVKGDAICRAFRRPLTRPSDRVAPGHRLPAFRRRLGDQGREAREEAGLSAADALRSSNTAPIFRSQCRRQACRSGKLATACVTLTTFSASREASEAEIKKAFRKLAKAHHPDRNANDPKAKDSFAELNAAYEILGDAEKRAQFDRGEIDAEGKPRFQGFEGFGLAGARGGRPRISRASASAGRRRPRRGAAARSGAEEIFSQLFGEAFRGGPSAARGAARPRAQGRGRRRDAQVTLEDIAREAKKRVSLLDRARGRRGHPEGRRGRAGDPAARPRQAGRGRAGRRPPDDPHRSRTSASRSRARTCACGCRSSWRKRSSARRVRVPTLTGAVDMTVPPMTSSGRTFRLRGKGLPGKDGKGDLLVTAEIKLPEKADEDLLDYARKRRSERAATRSRRGTGTDHLSAARPVPPRVSGCEVPPPLRAGRGALRPLRPAHSRRPSAKAASACRRFG